MLTYGKRYGENKTAKVNQEIMIKVNRKTFQIYYFKVQKLTIEAKKQSPGTEEGER